MDMPSLLHIAQKLFENKQRFFLDVQCINCSLLKQTLFIEFFFDVDPTSPICVITDFGKIQKVLSLQLLFPEIVGTLSPDEKDFGTQNSLGFWCTSLQVISFLLPQPCSFCRILRNISFLFHFRIRIFLYRI